MSGWRPETGPSLEVAAELLATREAVIEGRLPWSSNLTFLVTLGSVDDQAIDVAGTRSDAGPHGDADARGDGDADAGPHGDADARGDGDAEAGPDCGPAPQVVGAAGAGLDTDDGPVLVQAVYKPHRGEQSLWDFPDGLYRREVAAYRLSEALGWGIVPPTVIRDDAPFGPGSLQLFVESDYEQHYFTLQEEGGREDELQTFCAFDIVANNADRKSGHVLHASDGRLWGIDHGLCFHAQHKLRTVVWEFAGDPVPARIVADLVEFVARGLPAELEALLSPREADAVLVRAARLAETGVFPEPEGDRPPYPWPLV